MIKTFFTTNVLGACLAWVLVSGLSSVGLAQINLSSTHTENFDGMGTSGTASLPLNWKMSAAGGTSNWSTASNVTATTQAASSGTPTAGGRYNWGNGTTATDRAIGFMTSGSYASPNSILVEFKNTTGGTLNTLNISYDFERYRINTASASVKFFTSTDGSTWTERTSGEIASSEFATGASSYTFTSGTVVSRSFTVSSLAIANNTTFYLRWVVNTTGTNSQGIGLDNVTITAPASVGISDGSIAASDVNSGENNVVLQRYDLAVSNGVTTFNGLTMTTAGTYAASDISNFKLWYSTDATWDSGDELLATISSPAAAGAQVFPSFSKSLNATTHYIFVTADIASSATDNNTINVASTAFSGISFASGTSKTGTDPVAAAGVKTLKNALLPQTITFDPLANVTYGDASFTLDATASSGLTVSFTSSNTSVATVSGNTVTIVGAGATTITASQGGNLTYSAAPDVNRTLTVDPKVLTATGFTVADKVYDGNNSATITDFGTLTGLISGDVASIGSATFSDADAGINKTINFILTGADASKYTVSHSTTASILKANQNALVSGPIVRNLTSLAIPLPATSSIGTAMTYTVAKPAVASVASNELTALSVGSTAINVNQAGNTNYNPLSYDIIYSVLPNVFSEDFDDSELNLNPGWAGTSVFSIQTDATLPGGSASTDGKYLGSSSTALSTQIIVMPNFQTSEWRFSLGSGNFDPSSLNNFGVILMGNGNVAINSWTGYFLKIGVDGSTDKLELWKQNISLPVKIGDFPSSPNFGSGALKDGLNLRVTRSTAGVFEVFYSTGFTYASTPTTSMGTLTDNTYNTSITFGLFTFFANPNASRRAYIDNIVLGDGSPGVVSPTATNITAHTAIMGGNVTSGAGIKEAGIVWSSVNPSPSLADNKVMSNSMSTGTFTTFVKDLPESSTIYYRAYVIDTIAVGYTTVATFNTSAGNGKSFAFGQQPSSVIGQSSFSDQSSGLSATELNGSGGVAIDARNGKVYVADSKNNRVLRYPYPVSTFSQAAEIVFGQDDMVSNTASTSVNGFRSPEAVYVDNNGTLWVSDRVNNRVLRFNNASMITTNKPNADGVLGQANFTSSGSGVAANRFWEPMGIFVDEVGTLWVADKTNNRVLRFDNAAKKANGANADGVLGQANFTSKGSSVSATGFNEPKDVCAYKGTLFVADRKNNRVVGFKDASNRFDGASADYLFGQPNFTSSAQPSSPSASVMAVPSGVSVDSRGTLWVSTKGLTRRILGFADVLSKSLSANADYVLGPNSFIASIGGSNPRNPREPEQVAIHPSDLNLFSSTNAGNFVKVFPLYTASGAREEATEQMVERNFVAYPNPTNGMIKFSFGFNADESFSMSIFDVTGKQIIETQSAELFNDGLNLKSFGKGLYFVKFISSQGFTSTLRVVVE